MSRIQVKIINPNTEKETLFMLKAVFKDAFIGKTISVVNADV